MPGGAPPGIRSADFYRDDPLPGRGDRIDDEEASGSQDSTCLRYRRRVVGDVLENLSCADDICD